MCQAARIMTIPPHAQPRTLLVNGSPIIDTQGQKLGAVVENQGGTIEIESQPNASTPLNLPGKNCKFKIKLDDLLAG